MHRMLKVPNNMLRAGNAELNIEEEKKKTMIGTAGSYCTTCVQPCQEVCGCLFTPCYKSQTIQPAAAVPAVAIGPPTEESQVNSQTKPTSGTDRLRNGP